MRRWKLWVPILAWVGLLAGFLARRVFAPEPPELVIQPMPAARIPDLELRARNHAVAGEVLDATGKPIADVLVWVRAGSSPHFAYTDASGKFRLDAVEDAPWSVTALAQGYAPLRLEVPEATGALTLRFGAPLGPAPSLAKLERSRLSGAVTSRLAYDLDGAEVVLIPTLSPETLGAPLPCRARIGPDGRFAFDDLLVGDYQVEVRPAWAPGGSWPDLARGLDDPAPKLLAHVEAAARADFTVELAVGEATGRTVGPEGEALEGALILVAQAADPSRVWPPETSAADGTFTVRGLPAGKYLVSIRAGSASVQIEAVVRAGESAVVEPGPLEVRRPR